MLHLVGTITATTHVHQTDPNKEGNLSRTIKTYAWGKDQIRRQIPFITGNSIRGMLRRAATELTLDAVNVPISRPMFSVLTTGKTTRKDIGMVPSTRSMIEAGNNVFAGLFGGGGYMIPSRYSMGPLVPMVEWCQDWLHPSLREKMIPMDKLTYKVNDVTRDVPLVTELILTSRDDLLAGKGANRIEDYQSSVDAWIAEVTAGRVAKATDKAEKLEAKKRGDKPVAGPTKAISVDVSGYNLIEAMLPGTPLQFWMRLKPSANDAQVGLMLMAVRDWANANVIGGASARGFGRFEAQFALYDDDREIVPSLFNMGDHATAYTLSKDVDNYLAAAKAALATVTIGDLDNAFGTGAAGADHV